MITTPQQVTDFATTPLGTIAIIPIIVALVQVAKIMNMPNKFAPLASIVFGILLGFLVNHAVANLTHTILEGVVYGLASSGLYSGIQTTGNIDLTKDNKDKPII